MHALDSSSGAGHAGIRKDPLFLEGKKEDAAATVSGPDSGGKRGRQALGGPDGHV